MFRFMAFLLIAVVLVYRETCDLLLRQWWSVARTHPLMRWDSFEPLVVGVAFAASLAYWRIVDQFIPRHWLRRYQLHDTVFEDLHGWYVAVVW
jgi:hypothetical protein